MPDRVVSPIQIDWPNSCSTYDIVDGLRIAASPPAHGAYAGFELLDDWRRGSWEVAFTFRVLNGTAQVAIDRYEHELQVKGTEVGPGGPYTLSVEFHDLGSDGRRAAVVAMSKNSRVAISGATMTRKPSPEDVYNHPPLSSDLIPHGTLIHHD